MRGLQKASPLSQIIPIFALFPPFPLKSSSHLMPQTTGLKRSPLLKSFFPVFNEIQSCCSVGSSPTLWSSRKSTFMFFGFALFFFHSTNTRIMVFQSISAHTKARIWLKYKFDVPKGQAHSSQLLPTAGILQTVLLPNFRTSTSSGYKKSKGLQPGSSLLLQSSSLGSLSSSGSFGFYSLHLIVFFPTCTHLNSSKTVAKDKEKQEIQAGGCVPLSASIIYFSGNCCILHL